MQIAMTPYLIVLLALLLSQYLRLNLSGIECLGLVFPIVTSGSDPTYFAVLNINSCGIRSYVERAKTKSFYERLLFLGFLCRFLPCFSHLLPILLSLILKCSCYSVWVSICQYPCYRSNESSSSDSRVTFLWIQILAPANVFPAPIGLA